LRSTSYEMACTRLPGPRSVVAGRATFPTPRHPAKLHPLASRGPRPTVSAAAEARGEIRPGPDSPDPSLQLRFFDREGEMQHLEDLFSRPPRSILLLVGPQNSGKTVSLRSRCLACLCYAQPSTSANSDVRVQALLDQLAKWRTALPESPPAEGPLEDIPLAGSPPPFLAINCRGVDVSSPAQMANEMRKMATANAAWVKWFEGAAGVVKKVNPKFAAPPFSFELGKIFDETNSSDLASIIMSYKTLLDALQPLPCRPVIVIGALCTAKLCFAYS
jgi:hypothetical protein